MKEQKLIKNQLLKNMLYSFIAFSIIFTIFGMIIFNSLKTELYSAVDNELKMATGSYKNDFKAKEIEDNRVMKNDRPIDNLKAFEIGRERINPRIIEIVRDKDGNVLNEDSMGRFYNDFSSSITFSTSNIGKIYDTKIDEYYYRGTNLVINDEDGELRYVQLLLNVDSEKNVIDNYLNILTWGIVTTISLSILASYLLSKYTMGPIISSWKKQTEFVQNASHELRTPLTIIQTKQELLLQEPDSKIIDKSEDIRLTLNEAKRLRKTY